MRSSLAIGAFAVTALVSAAAGAAPVVVGDSGLVIDVEFWGRVQGRTADPDNPGVDIITYGDPVRGEFRIFADDAPAPGLTSFFLDYQDAVAYGRDTFPVDDPLPASFVTSRWLSPAPAGFDGLSPSPSDTADDYVHIGDGVRFRPEEAPRDWLEVSDRFTDEVERPGRVHEALFLSISTPLDVLQGVGLDQELDFELVNPEENGGSGHGYLQSTFDGAMNFVRFIVDRVRVSSPSVCKP